MIKSVREKLQELGIATTLFFSSLTTKSGQICISLDSSRSKIFFNFTFLNVININEGEGIMFTLKK